MAKFLLILIAFSSLISAQTAKSANARNLINRKETAAVSPGVKPSVTSAVTPLTQAKWDLFTNIVISAGQTVNLDSTIDYSSSDTVRVTVRSTNTDLTNLLGTGYFTVPDAPEYLTQEAFIGSDFFYTNAGGATFQVCGTQFRLALRNLGNTSITLTSVLVYTHIQ